MDSAKEYLTLMREIIGEAGQIALSQQEGIRPGLKADASVITAADRDISVLTHRKLDPYLQTGKHLLIDEEDPHKSEYLNEKVINATPYIWAIDPVDGTRLYANHIPLYAVSLGLIRDGRPWLGMVYFPGLQELFYCDGDTSFYVRQAFTPQETATVIRPVDQDISDASLFLLSDNFFRRFSWSYENCRFFVSACAALNLCWPVIGRAAGSMDQSHLWDFSGGWPIVQSAGLQLRHLQTGKVLDRLDPAVFHQAEMPWRLKEYHLLSSPRNFEILRAKIHGLEAA